MPGVCGYIMTSMWGNLSMHCNSMVPYTYIQADFQITAGSPVLSSSLSRILLQLDGTDDERLWKYIVIARVIETTRSMNAVCIDEFIPLSTLIESYYHEWTDMHSTSFEALYELILHSLDYYRLYQNSNLTCKYWRNCFFKLLRPSPFALYIYIFPSLLFSFLSTFNEHSWSTTGKTSGIWPPYQFISTLPSWALWRTPIAACLGAPSMASILLLQGRRQVSPMRW